MIFPYVSNMCFYFCTFLFLNKQLDKDERISTNATTFKGVAYELQTF